VIENLQRLSEKEIGVSLKEEELNRIRQQISNMEKDGRLKELLIKLRANGMENSPWFIRAGQKLLEDIF